MPLGEINEGMVQRCVSQSWRAVCGTLWDCNDARVLCRQLGFPASGELLIIIVIITPPFHTTDVLATTLSLGIIPWPLRDNNRYSCSGNENSLSNCPTGSSTSSCSSIAARALCQGGLLQLSYTCSYTENYIALSRMQLRICAVKVI